MTIVLQCLPSYRDYLTLRQCSSCRVYLSAIFFRVTVFTLRQCPSGYRDLPYRNVHYVGAVNDGGGAGDIEHLEARILNKKTAALIAK